MALETSPDAPAAVRTIANGIAGWINQLGAVWVEGQLTDVSAGRGMSTVFGTLRDTDEGALGEALRPMYVDYLLEHDADWDGSDD